MNLDLLAWIAPMLSVVAFYLIERLYFKFKDQYKGRAIAILSIEVICILFSLALSIFLLAPIVYLLAPMQIFSFANLAVPIPISFMLSFLFLDLVNYFNHQLHHKVPLLWRFHRLHHSDRNMDSLTTLLHHPLELATTFFITVGLAAIFDIPVIVLIRYGLTVGLHSAFTHMNVLLPEKTEKLIKLLLVTPNFHKTHHSTKLTEGNSNFGILFIFWDYVFKTYCYKSNNALKKMATGIDNKQTPQTFSVLSFLVNPFK